jgi:hypothetical protein
MGLLWEFEDLMMIFFLNLQGFSRYLLGNFRNL